MIINQVVSGGSSPAPSGKYQLLQRISDDSNNEIGTVCGFFTDANDVEYAVVCLDAQYRLLNCQYLSANVEVTGLTIYNSAGFLYDTDTATSNSTKILDFATANNYTSSAVSHCRSKSFVIDGVTYYGQLPNVREVTQINANAITLNNNDTSITSYPNESVPTDADGTYAKICISSTQGYTNQRCFCVFSRGQIDTSNKDVTTNRLAIPVLELPNA